MKRIRNGLFFAGLSGIGAFLLSWLMVAVLVPPGVDLIDAWRLTADVHLTGIIPANIIGFVYGYRLNRTSPNETGK